MVDKATKCLTPDLIRKSFVCCGLNLGPSNKFSDYLKTLNPDLRHFFDWEKVCWDKDDDLLSEFKKSLVGYKQAFLFSNECERIIQPYNKDIVQTFPHTWDSIYNVVNWSKDEDVYEYDPNEEYFIQEFFPQSFYKAPTKGTTEKKWEENCDLVLKDLILFEEEDIFHSDHSDDSE